MEFFPLSDTDAFNAFWEANSESIPFTREDAFALACNQCLIVGGGAAPLFCVGFVDE